MTNLEKLIQARLKRIARQGAATASAVKSHRKTRDPIDRAEVERLLKLGWPMSDVARELGCSRQNIWTLVNRHENLREALDGSIRLRGLQRKHPPPRRISRAGQNAMPREVKLTRDRVRTTTRTLILRGELVAKSACESCGDEEQIEIHHKHYDRPDSATDVVWLCRDCHLTVHGRSLQKDKSWQKSG